MHEAAVENSEPLLAVRGLVRYCLSRQNEPSHLKLISCHVAEASPGPGRGYAGSGHTTNGFSASGQVQPSCGKHRF